MNSFLKQSTASQSRAIGPFVDDTDFKTAETGLTIANTDIKLIVNGAASANKNSGGGTHRANGVYGVTFDATDTATVGEMLVSVSVSGALPVFHTFTVVEEAVYDMLFGASALGYIANAPVNAAQVGGQTASAAGAVTFPGTIASTTNITAGTITTTTNLTNLPTIPANWLTAAGTAADFTTEIQAGLATAANLGVVDSLVDNLLNGIIFGTAATGTLSTTQATSNLTGYANDALIGRVIVWLSGPCIGEASDITDYASASGLLTFTALTTAPTNGDSFKIV